LKPERNTNKGAVPKTPRGLSAVEVEVISDLIHEINRVSDGYDGRCRRVAIAILFEAQLIEQEEADKAEACDEQVEPEELLAAV